MVFLFSKQWTNICKAFYNKHSNELNANNYTIHAISAVYVEDLLQLLFYGWPIPLAHFIRYDFLPDFWFNYIK